MLVCIPSQPTRRRGYLLCACGALLLVVTGLLPNPNVLAQQVGSPSQADSHDTDSTSAASREGLSAAHFASPPAKYRPIDCWWWDGGGLDRDRLLWQMEEMHDKGVGGTWLYPRFGASQPQSSDPGFWTEGWWEHVDFCLQHHRRLGMQQWANDWLGRLSKNYFQEQLLAMRDERPELTGYRLVAVSATAPTAGAVSLELPANSRIMAAAAYRQVEGQRDVYDPASRVDLLDDAKQGGEMLEWNAPSADWIVIVVLLESAGLNYLDPIVAESWIELYFAEYEKHLPGQLGLPLSAYGPDERHVLNGDFLYTDELRELVRTENGYDLLPELPGLFIDIGAPTDRIRCNYHAALTTLLERNLYRPIQQWLHDRGMQQATIATWGRKDIKGQSYNYGDFFRMMNYFDITGNEDSVQSGKSAFIDTKLSSSIAHLYGHRRVAVCGYWGTGWGFTQEENIARTNVNFALGVNLINTHGGMYSFMGSRNEFVPPAVHFYQPYWQTWRTYADYVTRTSYVLGQGVHRADVAIVYPLSTLRANWRGGRSAGNSFMSPAHRAEQAMFALGEALFPQPIDFDFVEEASIATADCSNGLLQLSSLEFKVVLLPAMTTIPLDVARKLEEFVAQGGVLVAWGDIPRASAENGRDDPELAKIWRRVFGDDLATDRPLTRKLHTSAGGRLQGVGVLVRDEGADIAQVLSKHRAPDVQVTDSSLTYTHNQVDSRHVYCFVNNSAEQHEFDITVSVRGIPENWDAFDGSITPLHRFEIVPQGTRLRLTFEPHACQLVVLKPEDGNAPQVAKDNLRQITAVHQDGDDVIVAGIATEKVSPDVVVIHNGQLFRGTTSATQEFAHVALDGLWQCEYAPTMDNRWGDFRHPASPEVLGPECPELKYMDAAPRNDQWISSQFDDSDWKTIKCTYGPYWNQLGPFDSELDSKSFAASVTAAAKAQQPLPNPPDTSLSWKPYSYSWKHGADRIDVHQQAADDGLGPASDDFLVIERLRRKEGVTYFATSIRVASETSKTLHFGSADNREPRQAWVNGKLVLDVNEKSTAVSADIRLVPGWNHIVLRLETPARSNRGARATKGLPPLPPSGARSQCYAVLLDTPTLPEPQRYSPWMRWHGAQSGLIYDCFSGDAPREGYYRLWAPPGAVAAKLPLQGELVEGWVDGEKAQYADGVLAFPPTKEAFRGRSLVTLQVRHAPGCYEGAAFKDPIQFVTERGRIETGDWSEQGLPFYSGGLRYLRTLSLSDEQVNQRVMLDLGDVRTSATLTVNGEPAGIRLTKPFTFDITRHVKPGANEICVTVHNTLANHMSSQPSRYVYPGQTVSGLIGPAVVKFEIPVTIRCRPIDD